VTSVIYCDYDHDTAAHLNPMYGIMLFQFIIHTYIYISTSIHVPLRSGMSGECSFVRCSHMYDIIVQK